MTVGDIVILQEMLPTTILEFLIVIITYTCDKQ
jgi:hypothetical protein